MNILTAFVQAPRAAVRWLKSGDKTARIWATSTFCACLLIGVTGLVYDNVNLSGGSLHVGGVRFVPFERLERRWDDSEKTSRFFVRVKDERVGVKMTGDKSATIILDGKRVQGPFVRWIYSSDGEVEILDPGGEVTDQRLIQ